MGRGWLLASGAVVLAILLGPSRASGEMTKQQCVKANGDAQVLRTAGRLGEARAQLESCGDASCPDLVRADCLQRLDELERAQPTIVFDVKDASGADVSDVIVTVDGKPLASKLTGSALRVDPGDHQFEFTAPGQPAVVRRLVIKEGEKDRREPIALGSSPPATVGSTAEPESSSSAPNRQRTLGLIVGGVGLAGVVVGGVFGLMTFSAVSQQNSDCPQAGCANRAQALSDHSTADTDGTISTVSFIAGGALLAAGAILFFTAPHPDGEPSAARFVVMPTVGLGAGGASLRAEF